MTNKPIWNRSSAVVIGGWQGLWNNVFGEQYSQIDSQNQRYGLRQALDGYGRAAYNSVIASILGNGIGANATATRKRRASQVVSPPGVIASGFGDTKITQENQTFINRNTTAADRSAVLNDLVDMNGMYAFNAQGTWPVDKSGNGGGGKLGN